MTSDDLHPKVAFAKRYSDPRGDYLNAYTALWRLETLCDDAAKMQVALDKTDSEELRLAPWFGAEIISYYAVGFVTCLEWHARSRLADLFSYSPSSLKADDLKGNVSDKVTVELLAQGATVASLISASTSVGTFAKYMSVMSRVINNLGCKTESYAWTGLDNYDLSQLEQLFSFRNELTHEIGISVAGHMNVRDSWSPADAIEHGKRVTKLVVALENCIRLHAPKDFPNLLDEAGHPIWEHHRLRSDIESLEAEMQLMLAKVDQGDNSLENWLAAIESSRISTEADHTFIDGALFLKSRYLNLTAPLHAQILRSRVQYLKMLIKYSDVLWSDNPENV